jgi:hypothetical protein
MSRRSAHASDRRSAHTTRRRQTVIAQGVGNGSRSGTDASPKAAKAVKAAKARRK